MTDQVDVSIIIVNYNTRDILKACLQSIYDKTQDVSFEIIVVDNASKDASADMVRAEFPQVKLIASEENYGFAKGNNVGVDQATGQYIFYFNPDAFMVNNAVQILHSYLVNNPKVGIVGPRLYLDANKAHHPSIRTYTSPTNIILRYFPGYRFGHRLWEKLMVNKNKTQDVNWLVGAALMGPKELLDKLDGFDEAFFVYSEEEDLCRRVNGLGYSVTYLPEAEVIHIGGASSKQTPSLATKFFWDSQMIYLLRYYCKDEVRSFVRKFSYFLTLKAKWAKDPSVKEYYEQIVDVINQHSPPSA